MAPFVCVDPGHIGYDVGNVNNGRKEIEYTWPVAVYFRDALKRSGVKTVMTRESTDQLPYLTNLSQELSDRAERANRNNVDLFVSWHNDSAANLDAHGVGVWICSAAVGTETEAIARKIVDSIAAATGQYNRGVKVAEYAVLVETKMAAVLIEGGFNTNKAESDKMATDEFRRNQAEAAARAVCEYFGVNYVAPQSSQQQESTGTPIMGAAQATVEQAQEWAKNRGAAQLYIDIAPLYWRIAPEYGVRPEVAYAQAAKETGFGRFGGVIDASFHNFCGLKTKQGGGNSDPNAHQRFPDDATGVRAHIEHLALYAGKETANPVDPRHFPSIKGKAPNVEELGGKWAPNPDYGKSIVRDYLAPLMATPAPKPVPVPTPTPAPQPSEKELAIKFVQDNDLMRGYDDGNFGEADTVTREQLAVVLYRFAKKFKLGV